MSPKFWAFLNLTSAVLTQVSSPTGAVSTTDTLKSAIGDFSSQLTSEHNARLENALKVPEQ